MNDISEQLALIVCQKQNQKLNESDLEFSQRLYDIYISCKENLEDRISVETSKIRDAQYEKYKDLI